MVVKTSEWDKTRGGLIREVLFLLDWPYILFVQTISKIDSQASMKNSKKSSNLPISVLNLPPKNAFIQAPSPSPDYILYHMVGKKMCIEAYRVQVQKSKLFTNLQIYEWRHQTQFPIAKTRYVSIQPNSSQSPHITQLLVFNEHCPLKLNRIYQMSLAQTLYMLKQSMIGFERLYNRFGAFEITENMIAVNEKGFCRVWLNENFSINSYSKPETNQHRMVNMIQQLMQNHCQETKGGKRLFVRLRQCKTFLSALRQIDSFIGETKVLVASRFMISTSLKQIPRLQTFNPLQKTMRNQSTSQQNIRYSIMSSRMQKINEKVKQPIIESETDKSMSNSPNQIKRFKSEDKMRIANMKVSDGETAYTRNFKQTKTSNTVAAFSSPRSPTNDKATTGQPTKKKYNRWEQQEDFTMGQYDDRQFQRKDKKDKKQLSYSQAIIKVDNSGKQPSERKLSAHITSPKFDNIFYKFNANSGKKSTHDSYAAEFKSILDNDESPRNKIVQQDDEEKYKQQHTETIMKINGWSGFAGFADSPQDLNESFHEGQEQNIYRKQIKLQKLESIGKRPVAMSILPEQYEDIIDIL